MTQNPQPSNDPQDGFSATLTPYRSLGAQGFVVLMSIICLISFIAGAVFWLAGAWPVFFFFGLDVALIYWAFKANYASARLYETIDITADELIVRRVEPGRAPRKWVFHPYWVRVEIDYDDETCGPLYLQSHGRRLRIGDFMAANERKEFADALKQALARPVYAG